MRTAAVATTVGLIVIAGCGTPSGGKASGHDAGQASGVTATPARTPDPLAGALAVFVTVFGGSETSSVIVDGQRYSLGSETHAVVRAVAGAPGVVIEKDTSYSFAKSYIEPWTVNGKLYLAHIGSETGRLDLYEHDPASGKLVRQVCYLNSRNPRDDVAIVGERIYFITPIARDFMGNYQGGGDIAYYDLPCNGEPGILTPADKLPDLYGLHTAGGQLFAEVYKSGVRGLLRVDLKTGVLSDFATLPTAAMRPDVFYDGDDAFYFITELRDGVLTVAKLPLEGLRAAKAIAQIALRGKFEWACVDAAGGEVFVSVSDPDPRFFVIGKGGTLAALDLDPGLFRSSVCGQVMRLP